MKIVMKNRVPAFDSKKNVLGDAKLEGKNYSSRKVIKYQELKVKALNVILDG